MKKDTFNNFNINTMEKNTLNHADIDRKVQIQNLNCTGSLRRRLLDLGLVNGTYITPIFISPSR